jgi:TM2 domain-containing membrane protein YozV
MKKAILTLIIITFIVIGYAQEYSRAKAVLMSAVVPGAGQMYIGQKTTGSVFLATELALVLSIFRLSNEVDWQEKNYKQFAYANTGVSTGSESELYQAMHNYSSSEIYNESRILSARNYYLIYNNDPQGYEDYVNEHTFHGSESWDWGNRTDWMKYRDIRKKKQSYGVYKNLAISGLVINHLVSVIQTVIATRPHKDGLSKLNNFNIQPDYVKNGVNIVYTHRF